MQFDRQTIKDLRNLNGLSQLDFGRKVGTSRQMVQRWEQGDCIPQVETLCDICKAFGMEMDYFFTQNDVRIHHTDKTVEE